MFIFSIDFVLLIPFYGSLKSENVTCEGCNWASFCALDSYNGFYALFVREFTDVLSYYRLALWGPVRGSVEFL